MQAIAAIHGFDAVVGAEGQCGLFLGPLGFKGRTFGQAPGFMLPSEFLSTKAIRCPFSCRNGPASSNPDQGSNLRERCKDIALGERRRRPIRAARIGVVIDPLPDTASCRNGESAVRIPEQSLAFSSKGQTARGCRGLRWRAKSLLGNARCSFREKTWDGS